MKTLSRRILCSRCNNPIVNENAGFTEYNSKGDVIGLYCEKCGEEENKKAEEEWSARQATTR